MIGLQGNTAHAPINSLEDRVFREPLEPWAKPLTENLEFHAYNRFE
jgi:hypothetical protein